MACVLREATVSVYWPCFANRTGCYNLGLIPLDSPPPPFPKPSVMLYRLHVNSLLRERQVVALVDRFDVDRKGERKEASNWRGSKQQYSRQPNVAVVPRHHSEDMKVLS